MADMKWIKGRIAETIYPNGQGAITAEAHQALLLEMVDEINSKKQDTIEGGAPFSEQGNYPDLSAGFAENLVGRGESVPAEFTFRASGGKSIKDGAARIKRIKGNSVVWNNQSENSLSQNSPTQSLPIGSKLVQGHKYLMLAESITNCTLFLYYNIDGSNVWERFENTYSFFTSDASISANGLISGQGALWWYVLVQDSTVEYSANNVRLIDLTQMFQAGNEPTTIEEFNARKPIVADEYAYNEGEVIHMNTESIKSVGDNAWDEEWELGDIDGNTGELISGRFVRSKNPIPIIGGEQYWCNKRQQLAYNGLFCYDSEGAYIQRVDSITDYYTFPQNAAFIRFRMISNYGTTYNNDICIRLAHTGYKTDYEPYWEDTLPLPIIQKYFSDGMKSTGSAHDEIRFNKASGKWEKVVRIAEVDMGSLDWEVASNNRMIATYLEDVIVRKDAANDILLCAKYTNAYPSEVYLNSYDKIICSTNVGHIFVYDSSYTDAASFKAAMQGVMLYYELAEPVIREIDEPIGTDYRVADFGTEQAISSIPSAPFSADIIYQFNAVDMIRELWLKVQELESRLNNGGL